jgi:hypothetical protein
MRKRLYRLLLAGVAFSGLAFALLTTPASASTAGSASVPRLPGDGFHYTQCQPSLSGSAFPYRAGTGSPPPGCGSSFSWGFTVSGSPTGQAQWDSHFLGNWSCTAYAWIPDSHSNDLNAQYYIWDGSHYLANDAFVNQEGTTNGWVNVANNTYFHVSDHLRVTLNDHNPKGQSGLYIAAYAMDFACNPG